MAQEKKTIALMVTCLADQVMPEVGGATTRLLRRLGFEVVFPKAQTCCGQPFYNSGFLPEAERLAKRTIEIFEPYEMVVIPSGSCTTMLRKEFTHLFSDEPEWLERAKVLASKTFELSEFLRGFLGELPKKSPTGAHISYHDSCHMCRSLGIKDQPRELLTKVGYQLEEMEESDRCCGFGGLFSLRMPEVSGAMTKEKLHQAVGTGAEILVTADPGCLLQLRAYLKNENIQAEHLAVVLEEVTR
jgi:L-lactate dehydrogenase complex protein LldE